MLIDFHHKHIQQFLQVCHKLMEMPDLALASVADFYAAPWLHDFPPGTTWHVSGLDDGAEQFYAVVEFRHYRLNFKVGDHTQLTLSEPHCSIFQSIDDKSMP